MTLGIDAPTDDLLRDLAPQVLGAVARRYRDFAAAEDAVQEALLAASQQWPRDGRPDNPKGWLIKVASRRFADQLRAEIARRRREESVVAQATTDELVVPAPDSGDIVEQEDTLLLLFMSCHPSLSNASAIALTLRAVAGLTTAEIANAFLVPEATMAQRISRAKQTIRQSQIAFQMPTAEKRASRLEAVLQVLYLLFNEGYTSSAGAHLQRTDLSNEAIRLTRLVHRELPDNSEVSGLLALMLLTDARRAARSGPHGELIPLDEQDRTTWDRGLIEEGTALVTSALSKRAVGPYQLQAAIAAVHDEAARVEDTDWPQILALYALLMKMSGNPMVALNHAVATAMVRGPRAGLDLVARLEGDPRMAGHYRLDAVRGHLLERAGEKSMAAACYRAAAVKTTSTPERNYLMMKAARVDASASPRTP